MKQRLLLSSLFVIGLVLTSFAQNNINQYEYWFDNSFESKTVANITPATLVNLSTSIPTTGLPAGLHTFQIRFGETTGTWSSTNIQFFIKTKSSSPNNGLISRYEYWFDNNYEDKTVQTVSQQSELTLASALSASQLSAGLHTFQIRFQESTGAWSSTTTQYFYKPKEIIDRSGNGIIAYRYWPGNEFNKSVDVDIDPVNPLILNNVIIPVSPSKKVNPNDYQFHPNPLTNHTVSSKNPLLLNFQFKDSIGEWGSPIVDSIIYNYTEVVTCDQLQLGLAKLKPLPTADTLQFFSFEALSGDSIMLQADQALVFDLFDSTGTKLKTISGSGSITGEGITVYQNGYYYIAVHGFVTGSETYSILANNTLNNPPIAIAGPDRTVNEDDLVLLDGSASFDPDNDTITYRWNTPAGITLSSDTTAQPTFIAPEVVVDTTFALILELNDGTVDSKADTVNVTVKNIFRWLTLSDTLINLSYQEGNADSLVLESNAIWLANSDKTWLTVNPLTGKGSDTLIFTAQANPFYSPREATITISVKGTKDQIIHVTQNGCSEVAAGGLSALLGGQKSTITNLTLSGTIDARDFKTMRDEMPMLSELNLSGVSVSAYSGTEGTTGSDQTDYPADEVPDFALCEPDHWEGAPALRSVVLPASIISIGETALANKLKLETINIPPALKTIKSMAFTFDSSLVTVAIPRSVDFIGSAAFAGSSGLKTVDEENQKYSSLEGVLYNKAQTTLIHCPVSKTGNYSIPLMVDTIGGYAFYECKKLTGTMVFPISLQSIGDWAFFSCSGLSGTLQIPNSISIIEEGSFFGCSGFSSLVIPSSVTKIEYAAFYDCSQFSGNLIIPTSVNSIGEDAFTNCRNLSGNLTIPSSINRIERNTFYNCSGFTSLTLPKSVSHIGSYAFCNCESLTSISSCSVIPVNLSSSNFVFGNVDTTNCQLNVPFGSLLAYQSANQWQDFLHIIEMQNQKPIANSGSDQVINENSRVTLDGTASFDPEDQTLTFLLTAPEGIVLSSNTDAQPTFTSPEVNSDTSLTFILVVNDGMIDSEPDTVIVTVKHIPHFTPVWTGNGIEHMNINIVTARLDELDLKAGDEIGIFDGTKCVGVGTITTTLSPTNFLEIAVSHDDSTGNGYTEGNSISYVYFKKESNKEFSLVDVFYYNNNPIWKTDGKFSIGATSFISLSAQSAITQGIGLVSGWNIFSANVVPSDSNLQNIVQPLINNNQLKKVMDETGKVIEDWGAFGGWQNLIGYHSSTEGYNIKVSEACTLSVQGPTVALPLNIPLNAGWNIIGYPAQSAQDAMLAVQALIDAGQLIKVMDETGKSIEDWGSFGEWNNNIGNFSPGKGYKMNVSEACTLSISESTLKSSIIDNRQTPAQHFTTCFQGNGFKHMNFNFINLSSAGLCVGDEIAIYDGDLCVGALAISQQNRFENRISIAASASDGTNSFTNGFTKGNPVSVKIIHKGKLVGTILSDGNRFEQNSSLFINFCLSDQLFSESVDNSSRYFPRSVNLTMSDQMLLEPDFNQYSGFNCYPNPFTNQLTIDLKNIRDKELDIAIYDITGRKIKQVYNGPNLNQNSFTWNRHNLFGSRVIAGVYFCNVNGMVKKIVSID